MKLPEKVKLALEETRILILGAQILLGFGFRGVFDERFDLLPAYARYVDAFALRLLVCTIGLLIGLVVGVSSGTLGLARRLVFTGHRVWSGVTTGTVSAAARKFIRFPLYSSWAGSG